MCPAQRITKPERYYQFTHFSVWEYAKVPGLARPMVYFVEDQN